MPDIALESLTFKTSLPAEALPPLRALRNLRSLSLVVDMTPSVIEPVRSESEPEPTLAQLTELRLEVTSRNEFFVFQGTKQLTLLEALGPLPRLQTATIKCKPRAGLAPLPILLPLLATCTSLTRLDLTHRELTHATVVPVLSVLPALAELRIVNCVRDFGGLDFTSAAPHLAHTLEALSIEVGMKATELASEIVHLDSLQSLQTLQSHFEVDSLDPAVLGRLTDATVRDEFDTNSDAFRRDTWPHMEDSVLLITHEGVTCDGEVIEEDEDE